MPYLYLVSSVVLMSVLSILGGFYNRKSAGMKGTAQLYNLLICGAACVTWGVVYIFDFSFDKDVLWYSLGFGVCYAVTMASMIKALSTGPVSLTALMQQLSLIGTTVWGFIFWDTWDAKKAPLVLTGLALVVAAIALCLCTGKKEKDTKITWQWILYVTLVFVANAGCAIVQKSEQNAFGGQHGTMLMFFALLLAVIVCAVTYLLSDRSDSKRILKKAWYFPVGAGVCNAVANLFVILMATTSLSPNLIYPTIAVGGLMITSVVSLFLFKEKLSWLQWCGVIIGAVAVALLSIN